MTDVFYASLDCLCVALTVNNHGAFLVDLYLTSTTQHSHGGVLQFQTNLLGNNFAASQNSDVLEHFLAAVAEARSLNSNAGEGAAQLVQQQRGQCLAFQILSDDEQLLAGLYNLLQQRQQILNVGNLLVGNQDNTVSGNLFHSLSNQLADGLIAGRDCSYTRDICRALDLLRVLLDCIDCGLNALCDALAHNHRVCTSSNILHALANDSLCQNGSGGGAVACQIIGLGSNFLDQLCAHVLKRIVQLDVLGNGHTVVGDQRSAEFLVQNNIAALRTQSYLNRISQLVYAAAQCTASFLAEKNLLCHNTIAS